MTFRDICFYLLLVPSHVIIKIIFTETQIIMIIFELPTTKVQSEEKKNNYDLGLTVNSASANNTPLNSTNLQLKLI